MMVLWKRKFHARKNHQPRATGLPFNHATNLQIKNRCLSEDHFKIKQEKQKCVTSKTIEDDILEGYS